MAAMGQSPFKVSLEELQTMMEDSLDQDMSKYLDSHYGGVAGLGKLLNVDVKVGLSRAPADISLRQSVFGVNKLPETDPVRFWKLLWQAMQDTTLIILMVCGAMSLALSLVIGDDQGTGWIDGAAILVAVVIVVFVTAFNDYQKDKEFRSLSRAEEDIKIVDLVGGRERQLSIFDIVVGDVVVLAQGDIACADGILIKSNEIQTNESSLTGESDDIRKDKKTAPFIYASSQISQGSGTMLVCAVGPHTQMGLINSLVSGASEVEVSRAERKPRRSDEGTSDEHSPLLANNTETSSSQTDPEREVAREGGSVLQEKLEALSISIGKWGLVFGAIVVLMLVVRFCLSTYTKRGWEAEDAQTLLQFFITGVSVLVMAVPEGLPLAVTVALAYSVRKMLKSNNLVRHLSACETMGNATTICTDKTGTLTTNRMKVEQLWLAGRQYDLEGGRHMARPDEPLAGLLAEAISCNSTAYIERSAGGAGPTQHIGSKTECALLELATDIGIDYRQVREHTPPEKQIPFSSERKRMSTVIEKSTDSPQRYIVQCKGASEIVLQLCNHWLDHDGHVLPLEDKMRNNLLQLVQTLASQGLRTLCLAYRNLDDLEGELEEDLICMAIAGIRDPIRPEVPAAVQACQNAGIVVRMVTGDNKGTATAIAKQSGILKGHGLVMEGYEFRKKIMAEDGSLDQSAFDNIWPRLRVLARSSPRDKYLLVSGLMATNLEGKKQVVAVTGDGTNDAAALRKADVGFAMGMTGTQVCKNASDMILMDDNFNSIVSAVMWGRNVYDSVSKFLQFQLTVTVVALALSLVGSWALGASPLKSVQILWINLIMDTLASLALATDPPKKSLLERSPIPRDAPILTRQMARFIVYHSLFQMVVLFGMIFAGPKLLGFPAARGTAEVQDGQSVHMTMVFNLFVMVQTFNEINARSLHGEINVFKGFFDNWLFISIIILQLIGQVILVQFGGVAIGTKPLSLQQWGWCVLIGAMELPWNVVVTLLPIGFERLAGYCYSCIEPKPRQTSRMLWVRSTRRVRHGLLAMKAFQDAGRQREQRLAREKLSRNHTKVSLSNMERTSSPAGGYQSYS